MAAAFEQRHMGQVIRAYRFHPHHGRRPVPQQRVAEWAGLTQAQVSRIESGPPTAHMQRLIQWARLLGVPQKFLWFHLPGEPTPTDEDDVRRAEFLRLGATVTATAASLAGRPAVSVEPEMAAQALAWELWQTKRSALHPTELPAELAAALAPVVGSGSSVVREPDGSFALAHPSLVDFYVAQRIFGGIARGDAALFASAQTTHDTDQVIRRFVAEQAAHADTLTGWMRNATDPVLRVKSAGVLAKLGRPDATEAVIGTLRRVDAVRHRYITAVATRVLGLSWAVAANLASGVQSDSGRQLWTPGEIESVAPRLADEVSNPRDGAARWCSLVLLGHLGTALPTEAGNTLRAALRTEPITENLRAIGYVLSGASPLAT